MSRAGLKQIALCNLGTLSATPAGIVKMGLRDKATLEITPFKTIKDYRGRELPNMQNVKCEAESFQPSIYMLKQLISFLNHNVDCQLVSNKQSASSNSEDVYHLEGSYTPGIDFELMYTDSKRSIKTTIERAYPDDVFTTLLSTVESDSIIALGEDAVSGEDFNKYKKPYTIDFKSPYNAGSNLCDDIDIVSKAFSIKTVNKKSIFNSSFVDYLAIRLELIMRNASITKYQAIRALSISPSLLIKEGNGSSYYDAFSIAAGAIALSPSLNINDEERSLKLVYEGNVPLDNITIEVGATNKGDAADGTGLLGGTVTVAA